MKNYKTTLEEYKLDWENFDNVVIKNGWVKTSKTDRNTNTPVYNLIISKTLTKDEFYKNYCS